MTINRLTNQAKNVRSWGRLPLLVSESGGWQFGKIKKEMGEQFNNIGFNNNGQKLQADMQLM